MRKINHSVNTAGYKDLDQALNDEIITPLSRSEAQALCAQNPTLSPWVVLVGQAGAGLVFALAAWLSTRQASVGWSALYGAAAVVLPGALFARGLLSKVSLINPAAAVTGFFLWEMVKIGLVLAMLFVAPKLVTDLSWPAMLVGLVVTMKAVWLVLWLEAKARRKLKKINVS
jgi:ATP synthase protein I